MGQRSDIRLAVVLILSLCAVGCRRANTGPDESPEQAAARVFARAQELEKQHQTKQAFAAYNQIVRSFPGTPEGIKAAERIRQEQKDAERRAAARNARRGPRVKQPR